MPRVVKLHQAAGRTGRVRAHLPQLAVLREAVQQLLPARARVQARHQQRALRQGRRGEGPTVGEAGATVRAAQGARRTRSHGPQLCARTNTSAHARTWAASRSSLGSEKWTSRASPDSACPASVCRASVAARVS